MARFVRILLLWLLAALPVLPAAADGDRFWIGETGPPAPPPLQYPFICTTVENGLGQPLIDNQAGQGNAVFPEVDGTPDYAAEPVGYSEQCAVPTRVDYFYHSRADQDFRPLPEPGRVPEDAATLTVNGRDLPFVVRLERGVSNRFIYGIAMPAPFPESLERPETLDNRAWNGRLVYKFQGGVGIGRWQGRFSLSARQALHYEALRRGYAVAYSTGTRTGTHYDPRLAEATALRLKNHFTAVYGRPRYTLGLGASGGGVLQYLIAQNRPGLIDAAVAQMAYPDMLTQSIYVADCELLERYFDMAHWRGLATGAGSRWSDWGQRRRVQGLNTNATARSRWGRSPYTPKPGSSECVEGWRGSVPLMLNPAWFPEQYLEGLRRYRYPEGTAAAVHWSHWDAVHGPAPEPVLNTWSNVGVQYGLEALRRGELSVAEFLDLNACVGGWKPPGRMVRGNYPWNPDGLKLGFDPWDSRNMNLSPDCRDGAPAPRTPSSPAAVRSALASGQVFAGVLHIPVLDVRWYLEPVLDMHHLQAAFAARARLLRAQGHAGHQAIWVAACSHLDPVALTSGCDHDPTGAALDAAAAWLEALAGQAAAAVAGARPEAAADRCLDADGQVIAAGPGVWDGVLDDRPPGPCTQAFPVYGTPRIAAGEGMAGDLFQCPLQTVAAALAKGVYGDAQFSAGQLDRLQAIFPQGVCDYGRPSHH